MSELREKMLRKNATRKLKDKLYKEWVDCYNTCYNKSSYYDAKCGICTFKEICEMKYKKESE